MTKKIKFSLLQFFLFINLLLASEVVALSVETIPVEGEPIALALDEEGGRLFSLNFFNKTISIIDEKKLEVVRTIELGKRINRNVGTNAILYDRSLNQLFVTTGGGEVLIFNGSSLELTGEIKIDRFVPALASNGAYLYLLDWSGSIHRYKGDREDSVIHYGDKGSPYMHLGKDNRIYLSLGNKGLLVIDAEKGWVVKKLQINALSSASSSNDQVFVAGPGKLYIINAKSLFVEKVISIDYGNFGGLGTIYNKNNGYKYIVTEDNTVTIVKPNGSDIDVEKVNVCTDPKDIALNNKIGTLYIACPLDNAIAVMR